MIAADIAVLEVCLYLGFAVRLFFAQWYPIDLAASDFAGIATGLPMVALCFYLMGLYPGYGISDVERLKHQECGIAIIFSSLLIWDYLAQDGSWSRGIVVSTWIFAALLLPPTFSIFRSLVIRTGRWGMPVVIVGAGDAGAKQIELMRRDPRLGLRPVAVLDPDPALTGAVIAEIPVVGTLGESAVLARTIKVCVVAMPELEGQQWADLSSRLPFPHVVLMPDFGTLPSAWISPRDVGGTLGLEIKKKLLLPHNRVIKRVVELALCIPLMVVSIPLLAFVSAIIFAISPGRPPFYRQLREGFNGRSFTIYKLRTMYPDADSCLEKYLLGNPAKREEWDRFLKLKDDPRVLPIIGNFLRKTSLDELPQLFNVLRGEMSLVGPRAFTHFHLDHFDPEFRALRRSVLPGMTGLWQVEVRSDGNLEDQKIHDTYYIRNWSLWLDLFILFRTVPVVFLCRGAM